MTENQKDQKPLVQQPEVQTPLQSIESVATNKDEKYLKMILRLSVWVVFISGVSFICGIIHCSISYYTYMQGVWCPPLPFVAGVLGVSLKSNSKSKLFNIVFVVFSVVGAIMSFTFIVTNSKLTAMEYPGDFSYVLGIFVSICASAMFLLLVGLSVFGFKRCEFFGENEYTKKIVIVQSGNAQPGNSVVQPNQQIVVQPSFGNQPIVIQIFANGNEMVSKSNIMVPNSNVDGAYQPEKVTDEPPQYKNLIIE